MPTRPMSDTRPRNGRPKAQYSPLVVERLLTGIRNGLTYRLAAAAAGIHESTIGRWRERHPDFATRLAQAEAETAERWLNQIDAAAEDGNWTAAAWRLERRFPNDYAKRVLVDMESRIRQAAREAGLNEDDAVAEAKRILSRD